MPCKLSNKSYSRPLFLSPNISASRSKIISTPSTLPGSSRKSLPSTEPNSMRWLQISSKVLNYPNSKPIRSATNFTMNSRPKASSGLKISSVYRLINSMKSLSSITFSPWKKPDSHFLPKSKPPVTATPKWKNGAKRTRPSINKQWKPWKTSKDTWTKLRKRPINFHLSKLKESVRVQEKVSISFLMPSVSLLQERPCWTTHPSSWQPVKSTVWSVETVSVRLV